MLGRKNWKRRWFVLDDIGLTYKPTPDSPRLKGRIAAEDMEAVRDGDAERPQQFVLVAKERELVMEAPSADNKALWMSKLGELVQKQHRFQRSLIMSKRLSNNSGMPTSFSSRTSHSFANLGTVPQAEC